MIKAAELRFCSSYTQTNCTDNSTQIIESDLIKLQHSSNHTQVDNNDNSTQTIDTETIDPHSNNSVIITRDIIPLASETKDESIVEINHLHKEVIFTNSSTDRVNRKYQNLIQCKNPVQQQTQQYIGNGSTNTSSILCPDLFGLGRCVKQGRCGFSHHHQSSSTQVEDQCDFSHDMKRQDSDHPSSFLFHQPQVRRPMSIQAPKSRTKWRPPNYQCRTQFHQQFPIPALMKIPVRPFHEKAVRKPPLLFAHPQHHFRDWLNHLDLVRRRTTA